MAASVANTLRVDLDNTNINTGSAWQKAQTERIKVTYQIRDDFQKPVRLTVHWDGKELLMQWGIKKEVIVMVFEMRLNSILGILNS